MIRVRHGALKQCVCYWWYEPDLTIWSLGSLSPGISVHFLGRGGGGGTLLVSLRSRFSVYTQHPHQSYIYQSINQSINHKQAFLPVPVLRRISLYQLIT